jgi:regulator of protease activity HflC (stomatin/prohibitin superfamily)
MENKKLIRQIFAGVAAVAVLGTGFSSYTTLKQTEMGINYQFGKMETQDVSQLRGPGFSLKAPWTSVTKVRTDLQQADLDNVETYTKDNQIIKAQLTVFFKLPADKLVDIYKNNPDYESKLEKTVLGAAKSALGRTEAQYVAQNRDGIMQQVTQETAEQVKALLGIDIVSVKMPSFYFDKDFDAAVAQAANAKAVLNRKETELAQQKVEKEKTIVNAQATAEQTKLQADADAYKAQVKLEADAKGKLAVQLAQAQGLEKIKAAVGQENMGTYLTTQAWNGATPVVNGGSGTILDMRQIAPALTKAPAPAPTNR